MDTNVMFTDMVGYSKLTGDDQNLALELLKEHDKIIEPIIAKYKGSIVKRIGDAIVAIFDDSEDIIQSAVEIQQELKNRNNRNTQSRHIILRIGLHYGEITLKNDRKIPFFESNILGGSSIMNGCVHMLGSKVLWDRFLRKFNAGYKDILESFEKLYTFKKGISGKINLSTMFLRFFDGSKTAHFALLPSISSILKKRWPPFIASTFDETLASIQIDEPCFKSKIS